MIHFYLVQDMERTKIYRNLPDWPDVGGTTHPITSLVYSGDLIGNRVNEEDIVWAIRRRAKLHRERIYITLKGSMAEHSWRVLLKVDLMILRSLFAGT